MSMLKKMRRNKKALKTPTIAGFGAGKVNKQWLVFFGKGLGFGLESFKSFNGMFFKHVELIVFERLINSGK